MSFDGKNYVYTKAEGFYFINYYYLKLLQFDGGGDEDHFLFFLVGE